MAISRGRPPARTTALYDWMRRRAVTVEDLAVRLHVSPQWLSRIRTGEVVPSDELKVLITTTTRAIETEHGLTRPVGVRVRTWFPEDAW